ncbi:NAC domain containing protein 103 [Striga hermonthica]|uniref:NAC domain containing protein 103 n=1 Tax=Striga hermonthica TaxID=68872 RepID=A0A9N7NJQ5_STRHE|nr:NAC domain containing protein 103 [Striga hermonthica]
MARTSLPPGFRFHPTDEELILYYLKRKIMGKKFHLEAIAEVNIYRFSPWDLPDKSCLKSKDQNWFFFCPREKKYASGARVKRATENGYWKTTGKDRPVYHNNKKVGTIKTLIFHLGHAPQGERTNWVLHEYHILDCQLAAAGVQDTYVLCKIFQKNGLGPKNGAQYGAPFNEADWEDDDIDDDQSHAITFASDGPSTTLLSIEEQSSPPVTTGLLAPGNMSGLPLIEGPSVSTGNLVGEVLVNETDDEIDRLLAPFTDDDLLLFHHYGGPQDGLGGKGMKSLPCSEEFDIYNGLGDLDSSLQVDKDIPGFLRMENERSYPEDNLFLDSSAFIELDDLLPQLDCPGGILLLHQNYW